MAEQTPHVTDETHAAEPQPADEVELSEVADPAELAEVTEVAEVAEVTEVVDAAEPTPPRWSTRPTRSTGRRGRRGAGGGAGRARGSRRRRPRTPSRTASRTAWTDAPRLPRSEFQWTKLEFTPLVWRYDQEPETIDLREGAEVATTTVDVRDESARKQPRRKRARR